MCQIARDINKFFFNNLPAIRKCFLGKFYSSHLATNVKIGACLVKQRLLVINGHYLLVPRVVVLHKFDQEFDCMHSQILVNDHL